MQVTPTYSFRTRLCIGLFFCCVAVLIGGFSPNSEIVYSQNSLDKITASPAAIIVVDGGGGGDFTTIQAAVNSASSGDTIVINSGTYSESVDISGGAGSLTFLGNDTGGGMPTIQATGTHNAPAFLNSTPETADFTFKDLIIQSDGTTGDEDGIRLDGVTGTVRIENNTFNGIDDAQIYILGSVNSNTTVQIGNNTSTDGSVAASDFINLEGNGSSTIVATISDNNSNISQQPLEIDPNDSSTMKVTALNNTFSGSGSVTVVNVQISNAGITAAVNLTVVGNMISSTNGDAIGLQVSGEPSAVINTVIQNNTFPDVGSDSGDHGIFLFSGSGRSGTINARISENTFGTTGDIFGSGLRIDGTGSPATFSVILEDNNFAKADAGAIVPAVDIDSDGSTVNLDIHGNTVAAGFARTGFGLNFTGSGSITVEDFNGNGSTGNTAQGEVQDNNTYNGGGSEYTETPTIGYAFANNPVNDNLVPVLLGNLVWADVNNDGLQTGELGYPNVRVDLSGAATGSVFTDSNGQYLFSVLPGAYTLTVNKPIGQNFAMQDAGGNDNIDSDFNTTTGTAAVTVPTGVTNLTVDAGLVTAPTAALASISGRVVSKTGRGLGNVRVVLAGGSLGGLRYTQTNPFGFYRFVDLGVGETYVLSVSSKQYLFPKPSRVLSLQDEITDADFMGIHR